MSSKSAVEEPPAQQTVPEKRRETRERSESKPGRQPPYAVIVENDEKHTFLYVIEVLRRVCHHPLEKAYELTERIHFSGRAAVWTGPLEVAELKRDQIRGFGPDHYAMKPVKVPLGVRLEPLPEG